MNSLDDLIAYHEKMERQYRAEAERALTFKDEAMALRAHNDWTDAWKISRDTASWLKTIKARKT